MPMIVSKPLVRIQTHQGFFADSSAFAMPSDVNIVMITIMLKTVALIHSDLKMSSLITDVYAERQIICAAHATASVYICQVLTKLQS